jgi:hypothetical protein
MLLNSSGVTSQDRKNMTRKQSKHNMIFGLDCEEETKKDYVVFVSFTLLLLMKDGYNCLEEKYLQQ